LARLARGWGRARFTLHSALDHAFLESGLTLLSPAGVDWGRRFVAYEQGAERDPILCSQLTGSTQGAISACLPVGSLPRWAWCC
jgi:hypothetical protein